MSASSIRHYLEQLWCRQPVLLFPLGQIFLWMLSNRHPSSPSFTLSLSSPTLLLSERTGSFLSSSSLHESPTLSWDSVPRIHGSAIAFSDFHSFSPFASDSSQPAPFAKKSNSPAATSLFSRRHRCLRPSR